MKKILLIFYLLLISSNCFSQVWHSAGGLSSYIVSLAVNDKQVFALVHKDGVFSSSDFGRTWKPHGLAYDLSYAISMQTKPQIVISDDKIYVGSLLNGLYFSTNNGENWLEINLPSNWLRSFTVDGNNIFINTNHGDYISNDNGNTWIETFLDCEECTYCLSINDSNIYAGSDWGELYLSTDNGKTWNDIGSDLPENSIISMAVSGDTIYVGTERHGIYKSTNKGKNWIPINNGLTYFHIENIVLSGNNIYLGTNSEAIFLSTNKGQNWERINNCIFDKYIFSLVAIDDNIIAGTNGELLISSNNGKDWELMKKGVSGQVHELISDNNNVYVSTNEGLYLSTNQGMNWSHLTKDFINKEDFRIFNFTSYGNRIYLGTHYYGISTSSDNGKSWNEINNGIPLSWCYSITTKDNIVFSCFGNDGFYKSIDYGQSWYSIKKEYPCSVYSLAIKDSTVIAGTNKGIIISNDYGDNWIESNIDSNINIVYDLIVKDDKIFAGTDSNGIFISTDNGLNWTLSNIGIGELNITSFAVSGNKIYAGTWGAGIFLSTNNGKMWFQKLNGLKSYQIRSLNAIGDIIFALTDTSGIFFSTNNGDNWFKNLVVDNWYLNHEINIIYVYQNKLFAGGEYGLWCTTDTCKTWSKIDSGLYVPVYKSFGGRFTAEDNNILIIDDKYNLFHSSDSGNHWKLVNNNFNSKSINFFQLNNKILYAGTDSGFFKSSDYGQTWIKSDKGLVDSRIGYFNIDEDRILIRPDGKFYLSYDKAESWNQLSDFTPDDGITDYELCGNYIYLGTYERGIFISSDLGQTWSEVNKEIVYISLINDLEAKDNKVFVGSDRSGVHYSSDNGNSWREINIGIWDYYYNDVCVNTLAISDDNYVYTSPHGRGVYRLNIYDITGINNKPIEENELFSLSPNPSSDYIFVKCSDVSFNQYIKIYNILGNAVWQGILNGESIRIDVSTFPVGVYYVNVNGEVKMFVRN